MQQQRQKNDPKGPFEFLIKQRAPVELRHPIYFLPESLDWPLKLLTQSFLRLRVGFKNNLRSVDGRSRIGLSLGASPASQKRTRMNIFVISRELSLLALFELGDDVFAHPRRKVEG